MELTYNSDIVGDFIRVYYTSIGYNWQKVSLYYFRKNKNLAYLQTWKNYQRNGVEIDFNYGTKIS